MLKYTKEVNRDKNDPDFWKYLNAINQKHVDFVLCIRADFTPKLIIELDDGSHNEKARSERDRIVDDAFKDANIPILDIPVTDHISPNSNNKTQNNAHYKLILLNTVQLLNIELFIYTKTIKVMNSSKYLNEIILGDAVDELKKLPDRSVDLIILDPPYWKVVSEHWDYEWRTKNDYAQWCSVWFKELSRVIKLSGSMYLFGYVRNLMYLYKDILDLGFIFRQELIIHKGIRSLGGRATKGYKMFPNVTECLWFFIYDSKPFIKEFLKVRQKELGLTALEINERLGVKANGGGVWSLYTGNNILAQVPTREMWKRLQSVLEFNIPFEDIAQTFNIEMGITDVWTDIDFYKEQRYHTTQKPVKLIERIINASTNEGMVVLDPFLGSGSTALACINLNRKYIGIEKEKKNVDIAESRVNELLKIKVNGESQKSLFTSNEAEPIYPLISKPSKLF